MRRQKASPALHIPRMKVILQISGRCLGHAHGLSASLPENTGRWSCRSHVPELMLPSPHSPWVSYDGEGSEGRQRPQQQGAPSHHRPARPSELPAHHRRGENGLQQWGDRGPTHEAPPGAAHRFPRADPRPV